MAKKIAEYYINELSDWIKSASSYLDEIIVIEQRLEDIVKRNTIVDIAAKVEVHQLMLDKMTGKFNKLKEDLLKQRNELTENDQPLTNEKITEEIELKMKMASLNYTQTEKEYIDIKYFCNSFLIEMLKK